MSGHAFYKWLRAVRIGYLRWMNSHLPKSAVLILIAFVLGVLTGCAAAILKGLVDLFHKLAETGIKIDRPDYRLLVLPLAGIIITSVYQRYVLRGNVARGTRIIRQDLDSGRFRMKPSVIFGPVIGCAFTMGFGATGGTEGPIALSGSAIGSNIGRWFGLSRQWLRILIGIGAGAGISAIFKAPIGGVLFTLEVLQMELFTLPVIALVLACLVSSAVALLLSDFTFDIYFANVMPIDPARIGWVMLLGLLCGLYSIYYSYTKKKGIALFTSIRNPWTGAVVTGLTLSVFVFMFPVLFGEGFGVITALVNGRPVSFTASGLFAGHGGDVWMIVSVVAVLALKGFLVSASYSNGGVAGDFVPTLFAGAFLGFLFATLCDRLFGIHLPVWYFALIGMGAVMAGTIHAPLMAIFIMCETTNTFIYFFPYLIAIGVCYATVKIITPKSWYEETRHDDLIALFKLRETPTLPGKMPADVRNEDKRPRDRK